MAKSELRLKAREMRKKGISVCIIAKKLGIAKSSVSLWVRDIIMSVEQLEQLRHNSIVGSERVRLINALKQKEKRIQLMKDKENEGMSKLRDMTDREFFLAGIALYWAEGSKKKREVALCNSDPELLRFYIEWLKKFFFLSTERLTCVVGINEMHMERDIQVKKYWSDTLGFTIDQFRKTSFKHTKQHKIYENYDHHYGTLTVKVLKQGDIYYKILGLIKGLHVNMPR